MVCSSGLRLQRSHHRRRPPNFEREWDDEICGRAAPALKLLPGFCGRADGDLDFPADGCGRPDCEWDVLNVRCSG